MIGVSKTFGGSSILSSPAKKTGFIAVSEVVIQKGLKRTQDYYERGNADHIGEKKRNRYLFFFLFLFRRLPIKSLTERILNTSIIYFFDMGIRFIYCFC